MLVGINFGEGNNQPNKNVKNLSTKNELSDLLVKMGFKQNDDGVIMLLDDEKAKKSFFISKTVKQKDKESEEDKKTLYLKSSVLVQALMYNVVYKYSEQLKKDDKLRESLKKSFDSLIKRINKLYDNMHGQDDYDKNVYSEEVDNDIDAYNALSVDSDAVLNHLLQECLCDIWLAGNFEENDKNAVKSELKEYLNDVWEFLNKNESDNLENIKVGYLLIDNKTNPSKDLDDVQHVSWNTSKLPLKLNICSHSASKLFEPWSAVQNSNHYDNFVFGKSNYFGLGMGYQYKDYLKMTKDNFSQVLAFCHYFAENYYVYDEEKFGKNELKNCLYDRKSEYLDNLLFLIMKENKYSKKQIIDAITKFESELLGSNDKNLHCAVNLSLRYTPVDSNSLMIINTLGNYTGNYTYNSVLGNLAYFMEENEDGDFQFKNEQAENEFQNLNIEPNTRRTVLFSNVEFKSGDSKKKCLPQFLSFVPTKELLKTQSPTDKIYLMDFDRLNDIKDSDKFQFDYNEEHDYTDAVSKIAKEACRKCKNEKVEDKTLEFEKIFEHMKSMFMNNKIVFRDDNKEVMKYFFQFIVEKQSKYQPGIEDFTLNQYNPCVYCLEFMPQLYEKYKDSEQCNCIKSIAGNIFEFTLEKLEVEGSRINVNQIVKAMIKYKEKFDISVDNMNKIKAWMKDRPSLFSESNLVLYLGRSIDQITSHELMEALFEFTNWQTIIDSNMFYFLKHAGNAMAELDKNKEENKKLIENIKKIQWSLNNDVDNEKFRKYVQDILAVFDKNGEGGFIELPLISRYFGTTTKTVKKKKTNEENNKEKPKKTTKLAYSTEKIEIFTEETVKKFAGCSKINGSLYNKLFNLLRKKLFNHDYDCAPILTPIILNLNKIEEIDQLLDYKLLAEYEVKITFGPKAFAHIVNVISKEKSSEVREKVIQNIFSNKFINCKDAICDNVFHNDITNKDETPGQDENYGKVMQTAVLAYLNSHEDKYDKVCAEQVLCNFLKTQTNISWNFIKTICPLRSRDAYYTFEFVSMVVDKLGDEINLDCLKLLLFSDSDQEWEKFFGSYNDKKNDTKEVYQKSFQDMLIKVIDRCLKNEISEDEIIKLFKRFAAENAKKVIGKIIADRKKQILESKTDKNATVKGFEAKETKLNTKENNSGNDNESNDHNINGENKKENKQVQNVIDNKNKPINQSDDKDENNNNDNVHAENREKNKTGNLNIKNNISKSQVQKNIENKNDNPINSKSHLNESKLNKNENNLDDKDENEDNNNNNAREEKIDLENKPNTTKEKNNNNNDGQSEVISSNQKENTESSSKQKENINDNYGEKIKIDSRDRLNMEGGANKGSNINTIDLNINENKPENEDKQEGNPKLKIQVNGEQDINLKIDNKNINTGIGIGTNDNKINGPIPENIPTPYSNLNKTGKEDQNINSENSNQGNNDSQVTQANNKFFTLDIYFCIFAILALCVLAVFIKLWIFAFIALPGGYTAYKGYKYKQLNNQQKLAKSNLQVGGSGKQENKGNSVEQNLSKPGQENVVDIRNNNDNNRPYPQ